MVSNSSSSVDGTKTSTAVQAVFQILQHCMGTEDPTAVQGQLQQQCRLYINTTADSSVGCTLTQQQCRLYTSF